MISDVQALMGEFSLSGNANIGLSAVEISVNTSKNSTNNPIFFTTPTSAVATVTDTLHQSKGRPVMQDDLVEKAAIISAGVSGPNSDDLGVATATMVTTVSTPATTPDKLAKDSSEITGNNTGGSSVGGNSTSVSEVAHLGSDKLGAAEQVASQSKIGPSLAPLFHPSESGNPSGTGTGSVSVSGTGGTGTLWSAAIEDTYVPGMTGVNGTLGFQNFPSPNPNQQQLFGNNTNQNQGRRAITASHNFPHNMGRQQSGHPLYKGYGSWANPGQSWSGNSSAWNRGRSVPNLTPLQQMGVAGRKPSPTFNHQQVISPVKFRRSTSYPGKGPFPQPPTFEITNMDEARDLLPYQVMCGTFEHCTVRL